LPKCCPKGEQLPEEPEALEKKHLDHVINLIIRRFGEID
jgi:hypothetical protein